MSLHNRMNWRRWIIGSSLLIYIAIMLVSCGKSEMEQIEEQLKLGQKYLEEQNYEEAVVAFQKVIELDANEGRAYLGLAEAYKECKDIEQAISILKKAEQLAPENDYEDELTELYEIQFSNISKDLDSINEFWDDFSQTKYDSEEIYLEIADFFESQNMMDEAVRVMEEAVEICQSAHIKELCNNLKERHRKQLLSLIDSQGDRWAFSYGDFDNNGEHEVFAVMEGSEDSSEKVVRVFFVSKNMAREMFSIVMPAMNNGVAIHSYSHSYASFLFYNDISGVDNVTRYYILDVVDGIPELIYSEEDVSMSKEDAREKIDSRMNQMKEERL